MKPNLLFLNSISIFGGGEIWAVNTIREFVLRGYNVSLVCNKKSTIVNKVNETGAAIFPINISGDLNPFTILKLIRIFRKRNINVVIANAGKDIRLSGLASKFIKNVKVIARQGIDYPLKNNLRYRFTYNNLASGIIANSEATKKTMLKNVPWLDPDRVKVIYNGINPDLYLASSTKDLRKEIGLTENDFVIGFVGRFSVQKGIQYALEAFKIINEKFKNVHLLLCGEGELKQDIENFIGDNFLQNKIHLLGFRKDIPDIMRAINVLLTPSLWEGFGLVLIEAMASGKPCVASRTSSIPEIINDEENGILVQPQNSESIVEALDRLISNPGLAQELGENGLKIFHEKFTIDRMIKKYEELL